MVPGRQSRCRDLALQGVLGVNARNCSCLPTGIAFLDTTGSLRKEEGEQQRQHAESQARSSLAHIQLAVLTSSATRSCAVMVSSISSANFLPAEEVLIPWLPSQIHPMPARLAHSCTYIYHDNFRV